jgi:hypothetical protein
MSASPRAAYFDFEIDSTSTFRLPIDYIDVDDNGVESAVSTDGKEYLLVVSRSYVYDIDGAEFIISSLYGSTEGTIELTTSDDEYGSIDVSGSRITITLFASTVKQMDVHHHFYYLVEKDGTEEFTIMKGRINVGGPG